MKKRQLANIIGIIMIIFHFTIIFLVIYYSKKDKFIPQEMTITLGMIIPMFAVYITSIIKDFIQNQSSNSLGKKLNTPFVFISFFIPLLYMVFVLFIIIDQANNGTQEFEEFVKMLTIAETMFGVFTGYIISDLFGELEKNTTANKAEC